MTCGKAQSHFGWIQSTKFHRSKMNWCSCCVTPLFSVSAVVVNGITNAKFPDDSSVHRTFNVGTEWCFRCIWAVLVEECEELGGWIGSGKVQMQQWLKLDLEIKSVQIQLTVPNQVQKKPVSRSGWGPLAVVAGANVHDTVARKDVVSRYRRASKAKGTGTTSVFR